MTIPESRGVKNQGRLLCLLQPGLIRIAGRRNAVGEQIQGRPAGLGDKTAFEADSLDTFTCSYEISPSGIYIEVVLVVFVVIPESAAKKNIIRT